MLIFAFPPSVRETSEIVYPPDLIESVLEDSGTPIILTKVC